MLRKDSKRSTALKRDLCILFKQLFEIRKGPTPWAKAVSAGLCASLPIMTGILAGQFNIGLLAGIGGFTYLYVFNETYSARRKKIFLVAVGISASVGLGTLVAPYPLLVIPIVGLIGALATFIFGVFKVPGPAAIFFVLSFLITTAMPIDPSEAPLRAVAVFASGMFAWALSMIGFFYSPHKPEVKSVEDVFTSLEEFSRAVGGPLINSARESAVESLRRCENTLSTGYISKKNRRRFNRLLLLNEKANELLLELLEVSFYKDDAIPNEICGMIRKLRTGIRLNNGVADRICLVRLSGGIALEYERLLAVIHSIEDAVNKPLDEIDHEADTTRPSFGTKVMNSLDKDSIVFVNSMRYGLVLSISAVVAFCLPFTRPYWIPLSCAAVMFGSTIMTTFNRAVLRTLGTIAGVAAASMILSMDPRGVAVAVIVMILSTLMELVVVRNYALVAIFMTPNAIMLAETATNIHNIYYFAAGRVTDVLVGSAIGLAGTYIIGHGSASGRLPGLIAKLIRSQSHVIGLLSANKEERIHDMKLAKEKMEINLTNLKLAYSTSLGEIPKDHEKLEFMWPAISSLDHISYLLGNDCSGPGYLNISDEDLLQVLRVLESVSTAAEQKQVLKEKMELDISAMPKACREINMLQDALSMKNMLS